MRLASGEALDCALKQTDPSSLGRKNPVIRIQAQGQLNSSQSDFTCSSNVAAYSEFAKEPFVPEPYGPKGKQLKTWVADAGSHSQLRQACLAQTASADNGGGRHAMRGAGWSWSFIGEASTYAHNMNPNENSCFSHQGDWFGSTLNAASSYHVGGVQVALADGSVRFVSDNIDNETWARLGTRNDGQVLGEF